MIASGGDASHAQETGSLAPIRLGIDIGGTKTAIALGDDEGNLLARSRRPTHPSDRPSEDLARVAEDARALARLIRGVRCKVNLLPFNASPVLPYERPDEAAVDRFARVLAAKGVTVTVRKSRGRDIEAACGLLAAGLPKRAQQTASHPSPPSDRPAV